MHFKSNGARLLSALGLISLLASGCGLFGKKDPSDIEVALEDTTKGCLNHFGTKMSEYLKGEIEAQEWQATIDCALQAYQDFRNQVQGSAENGYTPTDLLTFVNEILITEGDKVTEDLVHSTFELKSALFGGNRESISYDEFDRLIEVFKTIREESISLIPHLAHRAKKTLPSQMIALTDAISRFGDKLAASFHTQNNRPFHVQTAITFMREIGKLAGIQVDPTHIPAAYAAIAILTHGTNDGIQGEMWPRLIRLGAVLGGATAAGLSIDQSKLTGPNEYGEFMYSLSKRVRIVLDQMLDWNAGQIDIQRLQWLLDQIPEAWTFGLPKAALAQTLEPTLRRIFQTGALDGQGHAYAFDRKSMDTIFTLGDQWMRGQTHLEKIFKNYGLSADGVTTEQFTNAALNYYQGLSPQGQEDVLRLIYLATRFPPMFRNHMAQMTFERSYNHSLTNLTNLHWGEIAARHLLKGFSSQPDKTMAVDVDIRSFFFEFEEILLATKLLDRTLPADYYSKIYRKHFRQANLFTYVGNGDGFIDVEEATNYLLVIVSTTDLAAKIRHEIEPKCKYADNRRDPLDWLWMEVNCFRDQFYGQTMFWSNFPLMLAHYQSLNADGRRTLQNSMEHGARRINFREPDDIGSNDVGGFAGLLHFIEAVFLRFDQNLDQHLDKNEAILAYPIFKKIIIDISNGELSWDDDTKTRAVFTYMLKHGHPPGILPKREDGSDPTWLQVLADKANFLIWWKTGPALWNLKADRSTVYQVLQFF